MSFAVRGIGSAGSVRWACPPSDKERNATVRGCVLLVATGGEVSVDDRERSPMSGQRRERPTPGVSCGALMSFNDGLVRLTSLANESGRGMDALGTHAEPGSLENPWKYEKVRKGDH